MENNLSVVEQLRESASYMVQSFQVGGLVSGLLLFQIILLALMGSNNSALEIAGERPLFESEKLAGLSSGSYVAAKGTFLALLVTAQSVWMVLFVHAVCRFPGDIFGQIGLLWLANAALTAVCLAFSSLARTPSQASLISIYFVGFQLPLSGAVLALPDWAIHLTRPFIAGYWSWAGTIQTLARHAFLRPDRPDHEDRSGGGADVFFRVAGARGAGRDCGVLRLSAQRMGVIDVEIG